MQRFVFIFTSVYNNQVAALNIFWRYFSFSPERDVVKLRNLKLSSANSLWLTLLPFGISLVASRICSCLFSISLPPDELGGIISPLSTFLKATSTIPDEGLVIRNGTVVLSCRQDNACIPVSLFELSCDTTGRHLQMFLCLAALYQEGNNTTHGRERNVIKKIIMKWRRYRRENDV